jgi:transcriptional regulator with XRE-family HTH domain
MGRNNHSHKAISAVANMLTAAIEKSGMTQRDLAAHLNVSEARVSQILSGKANLTIQTLAKIASILKMDLCIGLHDPGQ